MPVVMDGAMDVFSLIVIAVIVVNIVSSIVKGLRSAGTTRAKQADAEARQRLAQSLQPRPVASQAAADRAAEFARLRRALLASAGVSDAEDADDATPRPAYQTSTMPASAPAAAGASMAAGLAARALQLQPTPLTPSMGGTSTLAPTPVGWSLETPGALMTLESASTAFQQIAAPGSAAATGQSAASMAPGAPARLALLQGADSGMNLFIAAAIVGPCAAFRPIGHTPGGW